MTALYLQIFRLWTRPAWQFSPITRSGHNTLISFVFALNSPKNEFAQDRQNRQTSDPARQTRLSIPIAKTPARLDIVLFGFQTAGSQP
jgi:hypothetical protein